MASGPLFYKEAGHHSIPYNHRGAQDIEAEQKADLLAQHFEMNHKLTIPQQPTAHARAVERMVDKFCKEQGQVVEDLPSIHPTEVRHLLQKFKPRKAPGYDGVSNILLRHLPPKGITNLTRLF